jgi:hypothetical protein
VLKLGTIEEEAALCRKAWEGKRVLNWAWHCHHDRLCEPLSDTFERRIDYILQFKAQEEQALRLRLFRPVSDQHEEIGRGTLDFSPGAGFTGGSGFTAWRAYHEARHMAYTTYTDICRASSATCDSALRELQEKVEHAGVGNVAADYAGAAYRAARVAASNADLCAREVALRAFHASADAVLATYNAAMAELHAADCPAGPDCPWNGHDIFTSLT